MPAGNNSQVARAWANGYSAKSGNMSTDGRTIWSYGHRIGYTLDGAKVAICCHYSMTTAHHCSLVKGEATQLTECQEDYRPQCAVYKATLLPERLVARAS